MTVSNIVLRALKKVTSVLNKHNLDWCLFGGLAMQAYKRIRATKDVDLMVAVNTGEATGLIPPMEKEGFRFDRKKGIIKINGFELLRFIHIDEDTNFDIFIDIVTATSEFQRQILSRKTETEFLGVKINIASLEDLILLKLLADRPIDFVDAQVLFEENKEDINNNYLENWVKKLGITKKLKEISKGNA